MSVHACKRDTSSPPLRHQHRGRGTENLHNLDFVSAARSIINRERVLRLVDFPACVASWPPQGCSQTTGVEGAECVDQDLDRQSASANGLLDLGAFGRRNRRMSLWPLIGPSDMEHARCLVRLNSASALWWVVAPASVTAVRLEDIGSQVMGIFT